MKALLGGWSPEARRLAAILLLAAAVRSVAAVQARVINHDGARFTAMARFLQEGESEAALEVEPRMPLAYPLAIVGVARIVGDLRLAGQIVSILCGTLALVPLFLLARRAWDGRVATLAALLLAIFPGWELLGGEVWSEPMFLLFFFSSIAAFAFAAERPSIVLYLAAGLFGGLAVQTRPEGIYTAMAAAGWTVVVCLARRDGFRAHLMRLAGAVALLAVFLAVLYPYAAWIHGRYGVWSFTMNSFAMRLLGGPVVEAHPAEGYFIAPEVFESGRLAATHGESLGTVLLILVTWSRVNAHVLWPFTLVGLLVLRRRGGNPWHAALLILVAIGYAVPTIYGAFRGNPFGERYALPTFLLLAPMTAIGMLEVWERVTRFARPEWRPRLAAAALAVVALAGALPAFKTRELKRRPLAEAGAWIRQKYGSRQWIVTMDRRVEHYADGFSERLPPKFDELETLLRRRSFAAIVVYERYLSRHEPGLEPKLAARFPLVHRVAARDRGSEVRIYEAHPRSGLLD